jgi:hypothetical protein
VRGRGRAPQEAIGHFQDGYVGHQVLSRFG